MKRKGICFLIFCGIVAGILLIASPSRSIFHEHKYTEIIIEPTCTEDGYTIHACDCGDSYMDSYVSPVGHTYKDVVIAPTCTENGYTTHLCNCGNSYTDKVTPALGHTLVSDPALEADCEHTGLSAGSHCGICGEVIEKQYVIEKKAHRDENHDGYCDDCRAHVDNIINIGSVEELKSISDNLNGIYRLTSNISLEGTDWISLGSISEPFSGKLYGMGYSITGLSLDNKAEGGLFVCNAGTIDGVTLENLSLSLDNVSGTMGGFAAYNSGIIKNCSISGNTRLRYTINHLEKTGDGILNDTVINYSGEFGFLTAKNSGIITDCTIIGTASIENTVYFNQTAKYPKYDGKKVLFAGTYGEIAAVNEGEISTCTIEASIACQFNNEIKYILKPAFPYLGGGYDAESNVSICFGGVVGKNFGLVEGCTVTGTNRHSISVSASYKNYGMSRAKSYMYIGGLVGENYKTINDCRACKSLCVSDVGTSNVDNGEDGVECILNLYEDSAYNGIIGSNKGEVSNTLYGN